MKKIDLKKRFKPLYSAAKSLHKVSSEESPYIAFDGKGSPGGEEFQEAIQKIYATAYTLKFYLKKAEVLDFGVPPLETRYFDHPDQAGMENLRWQLLVRIPEEVSSKEFEEAKKIAQERKEIDLSDIKRIEFREGTCIQTTHIGPYSEIGETYNTLMKYMVENEFIGSGAPHEVYLNDPRRCAPENLKTVIRIPIEGN